MKHQIDYSCIREDCGGTCLGCTLGSCRVCKTYEGGLALECPGVTITDQQATNICDGKLEFFRGKWWIPVEEKP
jgi:hypothetical protein